MTSNVVIYARTSPDCTVSAEAQVASLKAVAADHGWAVVNVFVDHQATVKKDRRPGEQRLWKRSEAEQRGRGADLVDRRGAVACSIWSAS